MANEKKTNTVLASPSKKDGTQGPSVLGAAQTESLSSASDTTIRVVDGCGVGDRPAV